MPTIIISGTVIEFPDSSESPDWSQSVIQFAQSVETALSGVAGAFDVSPQVFNIDAQNPTSTNIAIPNLTFSTTSVRSANIRISVYRNTSSASAAEFSDIDIVYNTNNSIGQKWEISREITGDGKILFNITDTGQVQFTTTTLAGTGHTGILSYSAKALLNS